MLLHIFAALALIALGMGVDAYYQRRIRIAECDAYETGYQQGKTEEQIKLAMLKEFAKAQTMTSAINDVTPSMAAPVAMPDTFAEKLRKHGRATWRVERC